MVFLIEYDPPTGTLVQFRKFEDSLRGEAEDARLDLELRLNREHIQHEVVLLDAPSEEVIRHTHGRYFMTVRELIQDWAERTAKNGGQGEHSSRSL